VSPYFNFLFFLAVLDFEHRTLHSGRQLHTFKPHCQLFSSLVVFQRHSCTFCCFRVCTSILQCRWEYRYVPPCMACSLR
jgi:hypothetical protein